MDFGFLDREDDWEAEIFFRRYVSRGPNGEAHIAQLVEHVLGKDEVIGSNPIVGSSLLRLTSQPRTENTSVTWLKRTSNARSRT